MTLEEAIKNREKCLRYLEALEQKANPQNVEAVRWSVKALKFMQRSTLTPPNEPLTLEHLRASPHGKIKDSTLQSICNRANEIACRPPEGEA